jgi:putative ABC transport system permease protein
MFKNYLKIAVRIIKKHKGYSFINVAGLTIGMACCILILLYIQDELSFDQYHQNADRIYRLTYAEEIGGVTDHYAMSPFPAAPTFASNLPEIASFARIMFRTGLFTYKNNKFDESGIMYADSAFFKIFSFDFVHGNPNTALQNPGEIVLTAASAEKIFGSEDPLGKILNLNGDGDLKVTGVINQVPRNSHFKFNYAVSMTTLQQRRPELFKAWMWILGWSYVLLEENAEPIVVSSKFDDMVQTHTGKEAAQSGTKMTYQLQKVTDIHLRSQLQAEIEGNGSINNVIIFAIIAVFILGIACINFMNLSTARSTSRGKEIGLRKVLGAHKNRLVYQFLSESILIAVLGMFFALLVVELVLPAFNYLSGKEMNTNYWGNWVFVQGLPALVIITGLIAGSYPAFFLSRFNPVTTLKGQMSKKSNHPSFRNSLVVLQFSISIFLIASTMLVFSQLNYMKDKKLGFDNEQVVVVDIKGQIIRQKFESFKNELSQNTNVLHASFASGIPGRVNAVLTTFQEGKDEKDSHTFDVIFSDFDFTKTYELEIVKGRDFSRDFIADTSGTFLINEAAANKLGWGEETVGKKIGFSLDHMGVIVGIVKDFHYKSLRSAIGPLAICLSKDPEDYLSLKVKAENISGTLAFIEDKWHEFGTERNFEYFFADEKFESLYQADERFSKIVLLFSIISIFVACLGLFGLASFSAERRIKEIGIRKVLGASVTGITLLLSKDSTKWVLVSNIIAWPIAWFAMNNWLQNFAYRIDIGWWVFALAGGLALFVALLTVSTQAIRAALANPVKSLRYE